MQPQAMSWPMHYVVKKQYVRHQYKCDSRNYCIFLLLSYRWRHQLVQVITTRISGFRESIVITVSWILVTALQNKIKRGYCLTITSFHKNQKKQFVTTFSGTHTHTHFQAHTHTQKEWVCWKKEWGGMLHTLNYIKYIYLVIQDHQIKHLHPNSNSNQKIQKNNKNQGRPGVHLQLV